VTTIQLILISASAVLLLGIAAISVLVGGRISRPKDWKKQVEKQALKVDKSRIDSGFISEEPPEVEIQEESYEEIQDGITGQNIVVEEKIIYEEVSEEEAGITRRQFLTKALRYSFGAFAGIQVLTWLGFLWPKITGGFGGKVDAGLVIDLKKQIIQSDGSIVPAFIPDARAYVLPFDNDLLEGSQFESNGTVADGLSAVYQRCVHLGCRVPWCNSSQGFECACHGSKYNRVGEYYAGPAPRNLDRFPVSVTDTGRLVINTGIILESPRAPIPSVKYPKGASCIALDTEAEES
jgi:cytochrome b6-f complex iron-sulfur subunit